MKISIAFLTTVFIVCLADKDAVSSENEHEVVAVEHKTVTEVITTEITEVVTTTEKNAEHLHDTIKDVANIIEKKIKEQSDKLNDAFSKAVHELEKMIKEKKVSNALKNMMEGIMKKAQDIIKKEIGKTEEIVKKVIKKGSDTLNHVTEQGMKDFKNFQECLKKDGKIIESLPNPINGMTKCVTDKIKTIESVMTNLMLAISEATKIGADLPSMIMECVPESCSLTGATKTTLCLTNKGTKIVAQVIPIGSKILSAGIQMVTTIQGIYTDVANCMSKTVYDIIMSGAKISVEVAKCVKNA